MLRISFISCIVHLLIVSGAFSQSLTANELNKIRAQTLDGCPCEYSIEYTYKSGNKAVEKRKLKYLFSSNSVFTESDEAINAIYSDKVISVDKKNKEIYFSEHGSDKSIDVSQDMINVLLKDDVKNWKKIVANNHIQIYMTSDYGEVHKVSIFFTKSYEITRVVIDMASIDIVNGGNKPNGDQIVITYSDKIRKIKNFPPLETYLVKDRKNWKQSARYAKYKLTII